MLAGVWFVLIREWMLALGEVKALLLFSWIYSGLEQLGARI